MVTDRKLAVDDGTGDVDYYIADVVSQSDYFPFGMMMPGRNDPGTNDYRYSFQGQEKDDEIKGNGNSINYKYRMHDPRVGRFFAVDPLEKGYPYYTPYSFSGNVLIHAIELEGKEPLTEFTNTNPGVVYFNTQTTQSGILFVTNDKLIRRDLTTNEINNPANAVPVTRENQAIPGNAATVNLPGAPNTNVIQNISWEPSPILDKVINVTSLVNRGAGIFENGQYGFMSDAPNTVETEVSGNVASFGPNVSNVEFPLAGGANVGSITFNGFTQADNFQILDQNGAPVPLTPAAGGAAVNNVVAGGPGTGPVTFNFIPPPNATSLTLAVTPTTAGGGIWDATITTSGATGDATNTPDVTPAPANVSISTNRTSVEGSGSTGSNNAPVNGG